jgi:hypothetical protein
MKLGISVKIDVSKIDKSRLYKGQKGTYLDLTTFINTSELDQYDNNGFISQSMTKEEREGGVEKTPILGNVKVFYNEELVAEPAPQPAKPDSTTFADLEEIPF